MMNLSDQIALGSAIISLISLAATIFFAHAAKVASDRAQASESRANDIAIGQSETALRDLISGARSRIEEVSLRIADFLQGRKLDKLTVQEKSHLDVIEKARSSAIENLLNAYEDACGKYRDNKIARDRFKKTYIHEIANLCDAKVDSYARYMHPSSTSRYEAIWKVYEEWHRLEN